MAPNKNPSTSGCIDPPEQFDVSNPQHWPRWVKRFERYRQASGLLHKADEQQCNTLLYIMGPAAEDILLTFKDPDKLDYKSLIAKLTQYFTPRTNIIFERTAFHSRVQREAESIEDYLTDLHRLAETCDYDTKFPGLKEELIRDRLVAGLRDLHLKEKLQLEDNLTLAKAVQVCRNKEQVRKQLAGGTDDDTMVGALNVNLNRQKYNSTRYPKARSSAPQSVQGHKTGKCGFCGGPQRHPKSQCPAGSVKCFVCGSLGHYAKLCRYQFQPPKLRQLEDDTSDGEPDERVIASVSSQGHRPMPEEIDRHRILFIKQFRSTRKFMLDTGADRVTIPYRHVPDFMRKLIRKSKLTIHGPDGNMLQVVGVLDLTLCYDDLSYRCEAIVLTGLGTPLLSYDAIRFFKMFTLRNIEDRSSTPVDVKREFPKLFRPEIGQFREEVKILVDPTVKPYAQVVPRPVPIPMLKKLEIEIQRLLDQDIIERVDHVTPWCSPIVCVNKGDSVRVCGDYTKLNAAIQRPYFPLHSVEYTLAKISGAKYFSKIDATKSFYQVRLSPDSRDYTTFICALGRFRYKRLCFGINCSTEQFVAKYSRLFDGLENVIYHVDDVLIFADNQKTHDETLRKVLARFEEEGITINSEKSVFNAKSVTFLGHVLSDKGIQVDPTRVQAINNFPIPKNKSELQVFLGVVQYASKFIANKSELLAPLNYLLQQKVDFHWGPEQNKAFLGIQEALKQAPTLAYFDPNKKIIVSADSSSYGLGSCLQSENEDGTRSIIAYASRSLTPTECRYAQIEKECLALAWACTKFADYIEGLKIILETDHKPLLQILQTKHIDELSPRLTRFRLRLMRYTYEVVYVPGKQFLVPDYLSRLPVPVAGQVNEAEELEEAAETFVRMVISTTPVSDQYLNKFREAQASDESCKMIKLFQQQGWPDKSKVPQHLQIYYQYKDDFAEIGGLLVKEARIIVPAKLRQEILSIIHQGHFGINKCRERAKISVWWPGLSTQIKEMVTKCTECVENRTNIKEPFLASPIAERPWDIISMDLFSFSGKDYLVIGDYYSKNIEMYHLTSTTEENIIKKLSDCFMRYGFCTTVRSDNGPQFKSKFKAFLAEKNIQHITSSPKFSQSNGQIESFVKICKNLLMKNTDINTAMLAYKTTPLSHGFSPAELFFGRQIRSNLPSVTQKYLSRRDRQSVIEHYNASKTYQANQYNKRHRTVQLPILKVGDTVWITDLKCYGQVSSVLSHRSYIIKAENGSSYRRNRWHLVSSDKRVVRNSQGSDSTDLPGNHENMSHTQTQSGTFDQGRIQRPRRAVRPPTYLTDFVSY